MECEYFSRFNIQDYLNAFLNEEEIKKLVEMRYNDLAKKVGFNVGLSESSSIEAITIMVLIEILKSHKKLEEAGVLEGAIELLFIGLLKPAECSDYYSEVLSYYNIMNEDKWSEAYRYVKERFSWVKNHYIYQPNYVYERMIIAKCEGNDNMYTTFLNMWRNDISYIEPNFGDNIKMFDIYWIGGKKIISGSYTLIQLYLEYFNTFREYMNQKYS